MTIKQTKEQLKKEIHDKQAEIDTLRKNNSHYAQMIEELKEIQVEAWREAFTILADSFSKRGRI